jgi:hypothetical protein
MPEAGTVFPKAGRVGRSRYISDSNWGSGVCRPGSAVEEQIEEGRLGQDHRLAGGR